MELIAYCFPSEGELWFAKLVKKNLHFLSFSFGYSDKMPLNGKDPIGIYGNGFKSGSMRLGKDAIVFSKSKRSLCVGMLSQTYLEKIGADQIIVPIVSFEESDSKNYILYLMKYYTSTMYSLLQDQIKSAEKEQEQSRDLREKKGRKKRFLLKKT